MLVRCETGSFTVESSIVFPAVFLAVLALLFGAMITHEQVLLHYSASAAAERAAFRWDNSHRDPATGIAPRGQYDGLYWRLTDDRLLQSIFGIGGEAGDDAVIRLPAAGAGGSGDGSDSLIRTKLLSGAGRVSDRYEGEAAYQRRLLLKRVSVDLMTFDIPDGVARLTGIAGIHTSASAPVADPVELIRTVDLARYYAARFGDGPGGNGQRKKAGEVIRSRAGSGRGKG